MIEVGYAASFLRQLKKLPEAFQEEAIEKIDLFRNEKNHPALKVHKLKGSLSGQYSFSVNFRDRIVFRYISKKYAVLTAVGDHEIYK